MVQGWTGPSELKRHDFLTPVLPISPVRKSTFVASFYQSRFNRFHFVFVFGNITRMIARELAGWDEDKKDGCRICVGFWAKPSDAGQAARLGRLASGQPDELCFGRSGAAQAMHEADAQFKTLNLGDREMLSRYMALSMAERKTVRNEVEALSVASVFKRWIKK